MPQNRLTSGGVLVTPYGVAVFISYRARDNMYRMKLPFGELYVRGESIVPSEQEKDLVWTEGDNGRQVTKSMELDESYKALEQCRQINLDLKLRQEYGWQQDLDHSLRECVACILDKAKKDLENTKSSSSSSIFGVGRKRRFPVSDRCLTCCTPSCAKHSSDTFRKEGITLCQECEKVFHMDLVVECLTLDSDSRKERLLHLVDLYDRSILVLKYSDQFIDEVADSLERTKKLQNAFNFTGCSAGIVSGVLGLAAAFTILTPVGPPLLLASLLFGGTSTSIQTGTEMRTQYFFEPARVCDRILALYGMILSVLTVTGILRDAALLDHDILRCLPNDDPAVQELRLAHILNRDVLLAEAAHYEGGSASSRSIRVDRFVLAAAAAEAEKKHIKKATAYTNKKQTPTKTNSLIRPSSKQPYDILLRNTRYMSRVSAGVMRAIQFAQFAGGALSAASLLLEARGMTATIQSIKAGSPCGKARTLRRIQLLLHSFPSTESLHKESKAYLAYMNERSDDPILVEDAIQLILQVLSDEDDAKAVVKFSSYSSFRSDSDLSGSETLEENYRIQRKPILFSQSGGTLSVSTSSRSLSDSSSSSLRARATNKEDDMPTLVEVTNSHEG